MEKQIRLNFTVGEMLHKKLRTYCVASGLSIGAVIRSLLESQLNRVTVNATIGGKKTK